MNNVQDEDEEDYMSQSFLDSLVNNGSKDIQSAKAEMTYSERRRQKEREHLANLPKPLHIREKEAREQGLDKEIGEENKGMAMLLKMGFKKGGTLGIAKHDSGARSSSGFSEKTSSQHTSPGIGGWTDALRTPIAIQMKQGRGGLGMDTAKRRQEEEELQKREQETHRVYDENFRGQKITQFEHEKRKRQLGAARGICMRMDAQKLAADPIQLFGAKQTASEDDGEASPRPRRMGRSNSFWWISDSVPDELLGTKLIGPGAEVGQAQGPPLSSGNFDHSDEEDGDLESNKEKPKKRIKLDPLLITGDEDLATQLEQDPKWGERPDFAQLEDSEKIEKIVQYLRVEHSYCFWCSAQYDGPEDLAENCPGETEDDH
ncbi:hypothetical protein BGX28_001676 [Mortierella sp. GBA30]|nr:hypothetical protein BGX28_001676 [Mortierella sp. GBA30]